MKLSLSLLGCQLATGQYFQTRSLSGLGCRVLDNCQSNQICIVDLDYEQGKCVNVPAIQRRDEEQLPGPQTLGIFVWTWIESSFFAEWAALFKQTNKLIQSMKRDRHGESSFWRKKWRKSFGRTSMRVSLQSSQKKLCQTHPFKTYQHGQLQQQSLWCVILSS